MLTSLLKILHFNVVVFLYFLTYISLNRTQISMFYLIVWLILYNRVRQFIFPVNHMNNWDCCCELSPPQQSQCHGQTGRTQVQN